MEDQEQKYLEEADRIEDDVQQPVENKEKKRRLYRRLIDLLRIISTAVTTCDKAVTLIQRLLNWP